METSNFNGMCRCCASEGAFKDIKRTYQWMGEEEVYGEMIKECFDIDLTTREDIAGGICEVCITQLRNASNFKKQVLHTEEQFKKHPQMKFFKSTLVKVEQHEDRLDSDDNIDNNSIEDGFSGNEFDVPIKSESLEEQKPKKRTAKASTSKAKKSKVSEESSDKSTTKRVARRTRVITIQRKPEPTIKLKFVNHRTRNQLDLDSETILTDTLKNKINLQNILLNSNATPIKCKNSLGYHCAFCPKKFPEPMNLKKHFLDEHNNNKHSKFMPVQLFKYVIKLDITLLKCTLCSTDFNNLEDLMVHLKCSHEKNIYTDVKNEILPFKFDSKELRCAVCNVSYTTFKLLQEHMNSHFRNYVCEICGAGYVVERLLANHVKRHGDGVYKCDQCEKTFTSPQNRLLHVRRTHLGLGKRNKCKFCDERFEDYWKNINHMVKEHGMAPVVLKCQACDLTYNNQRALTKHTKKDHLLERKHKCSECDMRFFGKSCLQKHMAKHTGIRNYRCDVCFKAYARKHTLNEHLRIHANDRRFSCLRCGQTFVQKCSWKSHMKSKHGENV